MRVKQFDPVHRGVVLGGDEQGVRGDLDTHAAQPGANLGTIEDRDRGAGVGAAGLATAGAAVQRCLIRVVLGGAAVRAQHHQPSESPGQAHGGERHLGEQHLLVVRHRGQVDHRRSDRGQRVPQFPPHRRARRRRQCLDRRQRTCRHTGRLGQGERRGQRFLGDVKSRFRAGEPVHPGEPPPDRTLGIRCGHLGDVVIRRDEYRAQITGVTAEDVGVADGHGEEPGEAESVVATDRLQVPAQPLRTGVDAGDHLGVHRAPHRSRLRRTQLSQQPVAVVRFQSVLPQHFPRRHRQRCEQPGDGSQVLIGDRSHVHRPDHFRGALPGRRNLPGRLGCTLAGLLLSTIGQQRRLVAQPHRQIVDQVDPDVPAGAPVDVRCPTRHPGQVRLQVGDPRVLAHLQPNQRIEDRVIGPLRGAPQVGPGRAREASVRGSQRPPGRVEAVLPAGHRPGPAAEEGAAPLGGLGVHRRSDRGGPLLRPGDEAADRGRSCGPVQQIRP